MATYKKYKSSKGVRYDWGSLLQFAKDNPELLQFASSMLSNQGESGQKQNNTLSSIDNLSTAFGNFATSITGISKGDANRIEKEINLPSNYFALGGEGMSGIGGMSGEGFGGKAGGASGYIDAAATGLDILAKGIREAKGVDTRPYEEKVKAFGNATVDASNNQDLLNAWSSRNYLNHIDKYDLTGGNLAGDIIGGIGSNFADAQRGAMAGYKAAGVNGAIAGGIFGTVVNAMSQIARAGDNQAKVKNLNKEIDLANARQSRMFVEAKEKLRKKQLANMTYNDNSGYMSSLGGYLNSTSGASYYDLLKDREATEQYKNSLKNSTSFTPIFNSPSTYSFEDGGGIYIKPSKRGTFTAAAKKHGKSVQEFASQVLANKENYSPAMVKKANFARNASHWHDNGGMLMSDYFNNGVTMVDQGGTHENNPHEGVQMGIAPDGKPNLVEEGEAIYKDYVFSNRLRVPKEVRNKYKLRGPKNMTFAEAFREVQKESAERPNDPISEEGLENMAMVLARTQEAVRGYEKAGRKAAKGGYLFDGEVNPYPHGSQEWFEWEDEHPDTQFIDIAPRGSYAGTFGEENPTDPEDVTTVVSNSAESQNPKNKRKWFNPSGLRYADIAANAAAVFGDLMGLTNNPTVYNQIPPFQAIGFNPLGNYIPVTHFDTRYAANQAAQQAAATRDAIMQSTLPSRYANLLAADYGAQIANGELLMKAALDDYDRAVKREEFNRGTNQTNSQLGLHTALANQDARLKYAQSALQQAKMNVDETNATMAAKAANLGNLAESLSNVGREADAKAWRDMLIRAGVYGTLPEKPTDWSPEQWADYQKYIAKYRSSSTAAKGGKIRKKKGLTY